MPAPAEPVAATAPVTPPPVATPAPAAPAPLILKDSYTSTTGEQTFIEVRGDAIHLQPGGSETAEVIPFNLQEFSLEKVDEDIRLQIARKISLLVPALAHSQKRELLEHVFRVLSVMAWDQLPRVRQMIAEELSTIYNAPVELVKRLAWDEQLEVSAPILEFSPLLTDNDLLDIIGKSHIPGALEAVSRRKLVTEDVTDAIVRNVMASTVTEQDARTINNLLSNKNAHFREDTLEIIVDEASSHAIWHEALVDRPELTTRTINKIARFVSRSLISEMENRGMISHELAENLSLAIASRLQNIHFDREKEADRQAIELFTQGTLDPEYVMAALDSGEREFVISAISLLANLQKRIVKSIFEGADPKAVTSVAWKAGISMRNAIQLQLKVARIHYTKILYAKDGTDYPLLEPEMERILHEYVQKAG